MPDVELGFLARVNGRMKEWRAARLRVVDNWRRVLKRAYTMYIAYFLVVLGVFSVLMTLMSEFMVKLVGPWTFGITFMVVGSVVGIARILKQPGSEDAN